MTLSASLFKPDWPRERATRYGLTGARVNPSSLAIRRDTLPTDAEHEALVASFLSSAQAENPARYAAIEEVTPILSRTRESAIQAREISAFSPSDEADSGTTVDGSRVGPERSIDERISVEATYAAAMMAPPLRP